MQKYGIILLILFVLAPQLTRAQDINAGFVQGLWYSSDTIFTGTPTRVYVALRNNTPHDLTGTVRFTDNGKRIGSSEVSALSGRLVEAWVDWTPTAGEHNISASLTDATLHIIGGGTKSIDVTNILAEDSLTIDTDTDDDGTGNTTDTDDDGDGISDDNERDRGSNPLVKNPTAVTDTDKPDEVETKSQQDPKAVATESVDETSEPGLEQYVDEGVVDSLLSNMTEKVESAKNSLDMYREKRALELSQNEIIETLAETPVGENIDTATITRSKIETKNSFLSSFITAVATLLQKGWTFALWLAAKALANTALAELGILVGILYVIYRAARSVGRRPSK